MRNSKRIKIVAGGTAVLFGVGAAFAAWLSEGTGTGAVTAGAEAGLTVLQDDPVSGLYPTGTETIMITVTNDNLYGVTISSLDAGDLEVDGNPACTPASSGVEFADEPVLSDYVAAGASETYELDVTMDADSADECQGAEFSVEYTANAASSDAPAAP